MLDDEWALRLHLFMGGGMWPPHALEGGHTTVPLLAWLDTWSLGTS